MAVDNCIFDNVDFGTTPVDKPLLVGTNNTTVQNGSTFNGTTFVFPTSTLGTPTNLLTFGDSSSLSGTATILFNGGGTLRSINDTALTIGAGMSVETGTNGKFAYANVGSVNVLKPVVNNGTISSLSTVALGIPATSGTPAIRVNAPTMARSKWRTGDIFS
jgi:hypothetical protein